MKANDEAAYVEYVGTCQDRLRRTAYLMTGDWSLANDITQEVLIKLYVRWPRLDRGGGLASYARRSVVSAVIDQKRRQRRRPEVSDHDAPEPHTADGAEERAERQLIMDALADVPPRQRACVVLRYFEDLSVAETAAALNCSEGNVKSQTAHGIAALRRVLGDTLEIAGSPA